LIYDTTSAGSNFVDLAKINFLAPSISYQRALSTINGVKSAIFISPAVYYIGSNDGVF
jgi:hypothetical protein